MAAYLAVHRKDANAGAHDKVNEVALTLGEVLIAPVAEGRHAKAPGSLLVTLQKEKRRGTVCSGRGGLFRYNNLFYCTPIYLPWNTSIPLRCKFNAVRTHSLVYGKGGRQRLQCFAAFYLSFLDWSNDWVSFYPEVLGQKYIFG